MIETIFATKSHLPHINSAAGDFVGIGLYGRRDAFEKFCSLTVTWRGSAICGILYHNYHPAEGVVEMSIHSTSPRWMTRDTVSEAMGVAFGMLGCQLAVARVSDRNPRAAKMLEGIGFSGVLVPRMRGRNEGEWIFTISDDGWRASRLYKPQPDKYALRTA